MLSWDVFGRFQNALQIRCKSVAGISHPQLQTSSFRTPEILFLDIPCWAVWERELTSTVPSACMDSNLAVVKETRPTFGLQVELEVKLSSESLASPVESWELLSATAEGLNKRFRGYCFSKHFGWYCWIQPYNPKKYWSKTMGLWFRTCLISLQRFWLPSVPGAIAVPTTQHRHQGGQQFSWCLFQWWYQVC